MKDKELIRLGFAKVVMHDSYWFELCIRHHKFITNDNVFNGNYNRWNIGYQNLRTNEEFWFNNRLTQKTAFKYIYKTIIGKDLVEIDKKPVFLNKLTAYEK